MKLVQLTRWKLPPGGRAAWLDPGTPSRPHAVD
jgi:hypothetical protein